ncbi:MAG: hypothetical protein HRU19_03995 [Pseudobacteriovorax sp.]|nr:hypothetical protein [Pseudobacteriovorax sp.]
MVRWIVFLGIWGASALPLVAQSNLRDSCRSRLAGQLMNLQNDYIHHSSSVAHWGKKLKKLEKKEEELTALVAKLDETSRQQPFDRALEERLFGSRHELKGLKSQIAMGRERMSSSKKIAAAKQSEVQSFKKSLRKVFDVVESNLQTSEFSVYKLEYKSRCGRFRYVCPLPPQQRTDLERLLPSEQLPVSCLRYAQILPPQRQ